MRNGSGTAKLVRMHPRHTKIVATLGPATDRPGVLDQLMSAGLDCARLNCSHGTPDDLRRRALEVRAAAERAGRPVALMFDLQGPKLRISSETEQRIVEVGDTVTFAGSEVTAEPEHVQVDFGGFAALVTERSEIVIGDGVPRMVTESVDDGAVTTRVVSRGPLSPRKGITVTYARPTLPAITEKDIEDLALAVEMDADFVALSFVRSGADMEALRDRLREHGSAARTIAKIEKVEGYERLDEIIASSDGIMVARGDYGVEAGVARVPLMQKDTIHRSTQAGKLVITATHMLESMISAAEPTRAEAADVANAVIDGTSAVMLSAETSVGAHPVEAVLAMAQIAEAAEEAPVIHGAAHEVEPSGPDSAVMHAAIMLADDVDAAALIVPTATGGTVRACAKYRRRRPIIALAHDPRVASQLALEWGVRSTTMEVANSVDEMIEAALERARDFAGLNPGDRAILTAGRRTGTPGATNLISMREIP
ncbi:MAG: pyruvate kinase [Solirubrobacteraceae bacterium]|nr:pyruvate kinase [Solirubrobacteraceae bacterium]